MKVGILGLQGSGKTTIFNSLTGQAAKTGGYSSGSEPNLGLIRVPDERIDILANIYQPKKTTFSEITFADTPPSMKDSFQKNLETLKYMEALVLVIRGFDNGVESCSPLQDLQKIESDLLFSDFAIVDKSLDRLKKERKSPTLIQILEKIHTHLEQELPLRLIKLSEQEKKEIAGFAFLSIKPALVVINIAEPGIETQSYTSMQTFCQNNDLRLMQIMGSIEEEISQLPMEEQKEFLKAMGIKESARSQFIRESYEMMNLVSFFTVGKDEVRAWTISKGTPAQRAAGKIHSDIERGFIRAEVVSYNDFFQFKDMVQVKNKGLLRLEGKEYQVQDGDIINFRFNV